MNNVILRPYTSSDREAYVTIYEEAFPPSERKPFDFMLSPSANDHYELLTVSTSSDEVAGLVILAYASSGGEKFALLDYLAISPDMRGGGIGHAILPLVRDHCHRRNARMFLEIEAPDPCAENATQRLRRKDFYLSCGLGECGVMAWMYETVMELLAYPEDAKHLTLEIYQDVVKACYPPEMGIPELINT